MKNKITKNIDPLPDIFTSEDEAGGFWDTHSTTDYEKYLEPADITIDIKNRHFEIEIDQESFLALNAYAKKVHKPVRNLASSILKEKLASIDFHILYFTRPEGEGCIVIRRRPITR